MIGYFNYLKRLQRAKFSRFNIIRLPSEENLAKAEQAIGEGATVSWIYGSDPMPIIWHRYGVSKTVATNNAPWCKVPTDTP